MIRQHKSPGSARATFAEIDGRICLRSDMTEWNGGAKPFRVTTDDGRAVIGHELKRTWVQAERTWKYLDDSDLRSDVRVDKSAILFSCDTAAEAVAIMEVSRVAQDEIIRVRRIASARIKALCGQSLESASDVRLLVLDDRDEWVNPDTGKTLLSLPASE